MSDHFKPDIPTLRGEANLERWDTSLCRTLEIMDLDKYIMRSVKEPAIAGIVPTDEEEKKIKTWKRERGTVALLIGNSLLNTKVDHTLRMNGWKSKEKDPFVTYTLVKKALTKTTCESIADILSEYTDLKRKNFDSLGSYLRRL